VNRYSKYALQSALDLTDGFCRYLIQDRCWGPQEILDAEAVAYDFQADAERMLRECIAWGDPAVIGRLRYFLAEDCRVHFVHKMDDRRVVSETARQLSQYSYQVVLEPGLGWAVQVDAATSAPVLPVAMEPEPEVTGALAELKVVLDELVSEQRKKYAQYEAKLATLSDADKAALYGQKAGAGLWDATIGGAVGLVKALPGFAAGYFKTLCKIAMLPSELATATARSLATGDMAPLKAEADKFVQPLVKTYDQAVYYKSALVTLYEDEQTMGLLNDFANDYWEATHPLERTEMGASAAADIVVTILLALVTAGVGAAANIAAKSARLAKAAKLLDKIAGMLKRTGHRNRMPKKETGAVDFYSKGNKEHSKAAKSGMPEPGIPKQKPSFGIDESFKDGYPPANKKGVVDNQQILSDEGTRRTVFSGHGSYEIGSGITTVPEGTNLTVYSKFGSTISDPLGNVIETNGDLSKVYSRTYGPGDRMPNYTLHPPEGLNVKGTPNTVLKSTPLSDLLKPDMGECHWAACTWNPKAANSDVMYSTSGIINTKNNSQWDYLKIYEKE
jgi:hypothetical protein